MPAPITMCSNISNFWLFFRMGCRCHASHSRIKSRKSGLISGYLRHHVTVSCISLHLLSVCLHFSDITARHYQQSRPFVVVKVVTRGGWERGECNLSVNQTLGAPAPGHKYNFIVWSISRHLTPGSQDTIIVSGETREDGIEDPCQ